MKRIFLISAFLAVCNAPVFAQVPTASYLLGGSSSFSLATSPGSGSNATMISFSVLPEIGKFVSEKWLIGGGLGYSIRQSKNTAWLPGTTIRNQVFSANFSATRYYVMADKVYFTLEYGLGASYNVFTNQSGLVQSNSTAISPVIAVSPGLAYFINPKWMIYARMGSLSYAYSYNLDTEKGAHNLGYNFQGNSFGLGVRYVLGTAK